MWRRLFFIVAAALNLIEGSNEGQVRFFITHGLPFDPSTTEADTSPLTPQGAIYRADYLRQYTGMMAYTPSFDTATSWYGRALCYIDSYAIYVGQEPSGQPWQNWVFKDGSGNKLYIPWGCSSGTCPQWAGDFSNQQFRNYQISQMQATLQRAPNWAGFFVDDVSMDLRVGYADGTEVYPIDVNTGTTMTLSNYRMYFAQYLQQIRAAFPSKIIMHNAIWFAGEEVFPARDPYIIQQLQAADYVCNERGINDAGLTGNDADYFSVFNYFAHNDWVHSLGVNILDMSNQVADSDATYVLEREYSVAGFLMTSSGSDYVECDINHMFDSDWWNGYLVNLGDAIGARYVWTAYSPVYRRDFTCGVALLNKPGQSTLSIPLSALPALQPGQTYLTASGPAAPSTLSLVAKSAVVLTISPCITPSSSARAAVSSSARAAVSSSARAAVSSSSAPKPITPSSSAAKPLISSSTSTGGGGVVNTHISSSSAAPLVASRSSSSVASTAGGGGGGGGGDSSSSGTDGTSGNDTTEAASVSSSWDSYGKMTVMVVVGVVALILVILMVWCMKHYHHSGGGHRKETAYMPHTFDVVSDSSVPTSSSPASVSMNMHKLQPSHTSTGHGSTSNYSAYSSPPSTSPTTTMASSSYKNNNATIHASSSNSEGEGYNAGYNTGSSSLGRAPSPVGGSGSRPPPRSPSPSPLLSASKRASGPTPSPPSRQFTSSTNGNHDTDYVPSPLARVPSASPPSPSHRPTPSPPKRAFTASPSSSHTRAHSAGSAPSFVPSPLSGTHARIPSSSSSSSSSYASGTSTLPPTHVKMPSNHAVPSSGGTSPRPPPRNASGPGSAPSKSPPRPPRRMHSAGPTTFPRSNS